MNFQLELKLAIVMLKNTIEYYEYEGILNKVTIL